MTPTPKAAGFSNSPGYKGARHPVRFRHVSETLAEHDVYDVVVTAVGMSKDRDEMLPENILARLIETLYVRDYLWADDIESILPGFSEVL